MSQPPFLYGHYLGQQQQQTPNSQPFNSQPILNHPSPYTGTHQQNPPIAGHHAMASISYEQNANRIPGLAFGIPSSLPKPSYRTEINTSWPQVPSTAASNVKPPPAQTTPSFQPLQSGPRPHEHNNIRGQTVSAPLGQSSGNPLEEGELSEGEFEDLYEPRETGAVAQVQHGIPPLRASGVLENRVSSASDADASSLYNTGSPREEHVVESSSTSMPVAEDEYSPEENGQTAASRRDRSGSYSPCLSPSELQQKASVNQTAVKDLKTTQSGAQANTVLVQKPDHTPSKGSNNVKSTPISNNQSTRISSGVPSNSNLPFYSVSEAKKKAQEAILGLWPLKIRYQNYVDEGFDENLIKSLFHDLGLDLSMPKPNVPANKNSTESRSPSRKSTKPPSTTVLGKSPTAQDSSSNPAQTPKPELPKSDPKKNPTISLDSAKKVTMADKPARSAAEERKDKIARKLAAKAQKTTNSVPSPVPALVPPASFLPSAPSLPAAVATGTPPSTLNAAIASTSVAAVNPSTSVGPSPAKAKTRAENNALLHQKLAALKKKEQERAAVAAAAAMAAAQAATEKQSATPVPTQTATSVQPLAVRTNSAMAISTSQPQRTSSVDSPKPISTAADTAQRSASAQPQGQSQLASASRDSVIPGLSLPATQSAQVKSRNLKRPVASDFDNYSTHTGTLKRTRTQETLIIDVSDDEDVEMDIGSPTDGPATSIKTPNLAGRQTPLAAYPPLSDTPGQKQRSSPASSTVQLPEKAGKLGLLHGRIEEMKRKIAEAEAKKISAKKSSASQTPSNQSSPVAESARLPKTSEIKEQARKAGFERRNRIASIDLPAVEAALQEKRDRLKELVSQAAQLELDVQAAEAEKQRLASEMQQLGDTPEGESTESSGQSPSQATPGMCRRVNPGSPLAVTDETQTPGSSTEAPSLIEPQAAAFAAPTLDQGVAAENSDVTSRSDTDMDMPKPQSPGNQPVEINEPSSKSDSQFNTPAPTCAKQINGVTEDPSGSPYPADNKHITQQEADASRSRSDENNDHDSTDSDVSMQTSPADSSSSDDESYEPQLAQISDTQGTAPNNRNVLPSLPEQRVGSNTNELKDEQAVDKDPFEPSPVQTDVRAAQSGLGDINGEAEDPTNSPVQDPLSYRSPFEYFRAYRFHPRFLETVPGGLKSMTYSSKIDPNKAICPHVLSGDQCPDGSACAYQHFESMVVPDGEIITQLGSSDMFNGEMKLRFIEGLKKVLNELKANKVRDFDRITKAIVEYRAAFLEDKTKVLPLDGITI